MISPEIHHTWSDVGYAVVSNPFLVGAVGMAFAVSIITLSIAAASIYAPPRNWDVACALCNLRAGVPLTEAQKALAGYMEK